MEEPPGPSCSVIGAEMGNDPGPGRRPDDHDAGSCIEQNAIEILPNRGQGQYGAQARERGLVA